MKSLPGGESTFISIYPINLIVIVLARQADFDASHPAHPSEGLQAEIRLIISTR
jgi:hypothetical protein